MIEAYVPVALLWGAGFARLPSFPDAVSVSAPMSDTTFPARQGHFISWRAFAIGANGPFKYQFWVHLEGSGWREGRSFDASNVFDWLPPAAGTYTVLVSARQAGSRAAFEAYRTSEPFVIAGTPPVVLTALTPDTLFPRALGASITWTAAATGGAEPLQYQFWRLRHGGGLTRVQGYGSSNSYTWTPGPDDAGTYTLVVLARSTGSKAAFQAWRAFGPFTIVVPALTRTSPSAIVTVR